jgi:pyruvate,orthophosphate dikinase
MAKATKWVYFFGGGKVEGDGTMRAVLGGKGAGLAEMTRIGLPVPGGFTITTEACAEFSKRNKRWPAGLDDQVKQQLRKLERVCKKKFGDSKDPLLLSVRSGAAVSMPGMMETILNLGLNDESVEGLARASRNRRFALDAYRRFIMMYGSTAKGVERELFDEALDAVKDRETRGRIGKPSHEQVLDTEVNETELEHVIADFKAIYQQHTHEPFPQDPQKQLRGAIDAVFDSWMAEKAVTYRKVERITGLTGTAVNVMQMVFGNMGEDSGTGVCFTRDPSTGDNEFYGDLLLDAQGEDVVAGVRTPVKLAELKSILPEVYEQLEAVRCMLEIHYQDMQDLEFTFERGKLYMLQCRTGKRSPTAAFKIAVDQATKPVIPANEVKRLIRKKYLPKNLRQARGQTGHHQGTGHPAHSRRGHRTPLLSGHRSRHRSRRTGGEMSGQRDQRGTRGSRRQDRIHRRPRRRRGCQGRQRHPGPQGDLARGCRRHARRPGHSHRDRRQDVPRRSGRARLGQVLYRRVRRLAHRLRRGHHGAQRQNPPRG